MSSTSEVGGFPSPGELQKKFTRTRIPAKKYLFACKYTQTEAPTKGAITEDSHKEEGDSEFQMRRSDGSTPAPTRSDNKDKGTSMT